MREFEHQIKYQNNSTIVFIDSRAQTNALAEYLRQALLNKTMSLQSDQQYTISGKKEFCVYDIIQTFTAHAWEYDREIRYAEFNNPSSATRIMIATTSLRMGVNYAYVERVIVWKLPIDKEPGEVWQRIGRGGRGEGRTSQAFIFLPYWFFDSEAVTSLQKTHHLARAKSLYKHVHQSSEGISCQPIEPVSEVP
jgi:Lhr-like helicase